MPTVARPVGSMILLAAAAALMSADDVLGASADTDGWQFQIVPYLWLPDVDASVDVTLRSLRGAGDRELGPVSISTDVGPSDYLDKLNMAFMAMGEARKGPWSIYTDVLYTSFGNSGTNVRSVSGPRGNLKADISRRAKSDLSTTAWSLAAGYRAVDRPTFELDLMAGFRTSA